MADSMQYPESPVDPRVAALRERYASGELSDDELDREVQEILADRRPATRATPPQLPGFDRLLVAVRAFCDAYLGDAG